MHFKVVEYFDKIPNTSATILDRFNYAQSIIEKFLNTEKQYDYLNVSEEKDNNFTECNICNQHLVCNHLLYGVELLKNNEEFVYMILLIYMGLKVVVAIIVKYAEIY